MTFLRSVPRRELYLWATLIAADAIALTACVKLF